MAATIAFSLEEHEFIELHNLLKVTGLCASGGEAKGQVAEGLVKVDGSVELRRRCKIRAGQTVEFKRNTIHVHGVRPTSEICTEPQGSA